MLGLPVLTWIALVAAALSAGLLVSFLVRRPPLTVETKVALAFGLGILPTAAAVLGNVQNLQTMKSREFCGSCHVMESHAGDAANAQSLSLASIHSRNPMFGQDSCYECHADYGMLGGVVTKLDGAGHVYHYLRHYHGVPMPDALEEIHLRRPYPNRNCMQCHSTEAPRWTAVSDHVSALDDVREGRTSCVGSGCHGPAHPFSKPYQARGEER